MRRLRHLDDNPNVIAFPISEMPRARHHFSTSVVLDMQTEAAKLRTTADSAPDFLQSCLELQMRTPQVMAAFTQSYFSFVASMMSAMASRTSPQASSDFTLEN